MFLFGFFVLINSKNIIILWRSFWDFKDELGEIANMNHWNSILFFGSNKLLQPCLFKMFIKRKLLVSIQNTGTQDVTLQSGLWDAGT